VRNRSIMVVLVLLAIVIWAGVVAFMHRHPPSAENQVVLVGMFGLGVLCTVMPLSYAVNGRFAEPLGRVGDMNRSLRQGLLAALVGGVLLALHLMRMLPPDRALVLVAIVVLLEALFYIRRR
jgi:hypothetical protein